MIISPPVDAPAPVASLPALPAIARGNLTDRVQDALRQRILSGEWPAGTRLPAIERLAADAGVSRTVAREAVRALATQGLLEVVHGHGTVVAASTNRPVVEALRHGMRASADLVGIVEVRLALEVEAAALAAERRTADDQKELRAAAARLQVLRDVPGEAGYLQADVAFHEAIVRATHNPVFVMVAASIAELLRETRLAIAAGRPAPAPAPAAPAGEHRPESHTVILERVEAGDAQGAAGAMRRHLLRVRDNLEDVVRRREPAVGP
jgi:GntR family transcriptional repressor for pyruvate dehydrogenase complex